MGVDHLVKLYQAKLPGVTIGFSGRNNLQVAFSNTVHAIIEGCDMVEGSILGLGLGAGLTPLENMLCFLKNPKFKLRPILAVAQAHIAPLSEKICWGYSMAQMVSGSRNMDPELAVAWENTSGKGKEDGLGFLDLTKAMDQFRLPSPPPKPFEGINIGDPAS